MCHFYPLLACVPFSFPTSHPGGRGIKVPVGGNTQSKACPQSPDGRSHTWHPWEPWIIIAVVKCWAKTFTKESGWEFLVKDTRSKDIEKSKALRYQTQVVAFQAKCRRFIGLLPGWTVAKWTEHPKRASSLKQLRREAISCDPLSFRFNIGGRGSSHIFIYLCQDLIIQIASRGISEWTLQCDARSTPVNPVGGRFNFSEVFSLLKSSK